MHTSLYRFWWDILLLGPHILARLLQCLQPNHILPRLLLQQPILLYQPILLMMMWVILLFRLHYFSFETIQLAEPEPFFFRMFTLLQTARTAPSTNPFDAVSHRSISKIFPQFLDLFTNSFLYLCSRSQPQPLALQCLLRMITNSSSKFHTSNKMPRITVQIILINSNHTKILL